MGNPGRHAQSQAKLTDCTRHGEDSELWLVEGDSAARSVVAVRDAATQAVLPLQGKPLNAWRAEVAKVRGHRLFKQLVDALNAGDAAAPCWPLRPRHGRVLLLFDPDADGVHIEALMLLYFARFWPDLIAQGRLWRVRAPMFTLTHAVTGECVQAYSPDHRDALLARWAAHGGGAVAQHRHVGLGSLPPALLQRTCLHPATRAARQVEAEDIDAVLRAFAPPG